MFDYTDGCVPCYCNVVDFGIVKPMHQFLLVATGEIVVVAICKLLIISISVSMI